MLAGVACGASEPLSFPEIGVPSDPPPLVVRPSTPGQGGASTVGSGGGAGGTVATNGAGVAVGTGARPGGTLTNGGASSSSGSIGGDGGGDASGGPEPECDPCPCDDGPFGPAEPITGLGLEGETLGPRLAADGRTLFFSSIGGDEDIFTAARAGRGAAFSEAVLVPNLDGGGTLEGTPFPSFDGLSLYFFSTRPGPGAQGGRDLWVATRPDLDAPFADPVALPEVNTSAIEHLPWLSRDELTLMFVSSRAAAHGLTNIWVAQRTERGQSFGAPVELEGVNTDAREEGFSLSRDGLTLYFTSNRVAENDMDIWVATRPDVSSAFGPAENLEHLNSPAPEIDVALSPDGAELFFSSGRSAPGGTGARQLFRAVRDCGVLGGPR